MAADKSSSKGQAWFCTTGLPSDIVVEVDDMTFHLHKFPLMSKSKKLNNLITEQETILTTSKQRADSDSGDGDDDSEIKSEQQIHIQLPDFPGGSETFETAAKFSYGVKIEVSAATVVPLRCAGEVLEMTEEYSEGNLIFKTERFLSQSVHRNLSDSIKALRSCERLVPLAETLGIVERCIDAVASKAAVVDPSLFGWPVDELESRKKTLSVKVKNGGAGGAELWYEELSQLSLNFFKRLITAMKERELSPEILESCLVHYARKRFPGITRCNRKSAPSSSAASEAEQRELLEMIMANLPSERSNSRTPMATRFLFGLLRTANILNASGSCKSALEKKIGVQLEHATLDDLLIPSYSYLSETLYDVECVQRILGHFLDSYNNKSGAGDDTIASTRSPAMMLVGKLIDGYLSEIASDANLKPERFCDLAVSLPEQARLFDDGLYRAVDVYLKAHPWVTEAEREICGVMDCQKLTLEACTHAAQNERLPLRAVVQVLFFEQLQLRHAIAGTMLASDAVPPIQSGRHSIRADPEGERGAAVVVEEDTSTWRTAIRENQVLRLDMDTMRTRVNELEWECTTMKKAIEKIDKVGVKSGNGSRRGWKSSMTRKFGCKLKAQVCDSHEQTVVETRWGRHQGNHPRPSS
ncbi:BTB/POZ domain-containing protein [Drosera capensis]